MKIPDTWSFKNKSVAENFQNHVREQLPWYDLINEIIVHIVTGYARQGCKIYDIGCSTGNLELLLADVIEQRDIDFIPVDDSKEMLEKYQGKADPLHEDIREMNIWPFDIAVCNLSLMFLSKMERKWFLEKLKANMNLGAIIIVVDKFMDEPDPYLSQVLYKLALRFKMKTTEPIEILQKELSLNGVQYPMLEREFVRFISKQVFQVGNFKGFVLFSDVTVQE